MPCGMQRPSNAKEFPGRDTNHAQRISIALERAAAQGMSSEDVDRWRRNLDRAADDICGCRASFVALTTVLAAGVVVQFVLGFDFGTTGLSLAFAFVAAVIAKGVQSTRVQARLRRELGSLAANVGPRVVFEARSH